MARRRLPLEAQKSETRSQMSASGKVSSREFFQRNGVLWKIMQDLAIHGQQRDPLFESKRYEFTIIGRAIRLGNELQNGRRRDGELVLDQHRLGQVCDLDGSFGR